MPSKANVDAWLHLGALATRIELHCVRARRSLLLPETVAFVSLTPAIAA
jgi:hypothetical protein